MKYKTAFRLLLKAIGVYMIAQSISWLVPTCCSCALAVALDGALGFGSDWSAWESRYLVANGISLVIGLYLFFGGRRIVNRAIPSNRPYCHECGYELSGLGVDGICPECGTVYQRSGAH